MSPIRATQALPSAPQQERTYLLDAYNRIFASPGGPATAADVVFTWSGVRALAGRRCGSTQPRQPQPGPRASSQRHGRLVTLYGGKLTTHRAFAEEVLDALGGLGARIGPSWTKDVPLHGGTLSREALTRPRRTRTALSAHRLRQRWAFTYGDQIEALYGRIAREPQVRPRRSLPA